MASPAKKERNDRYTFADLLAWDEDERIEIINGKAFMMAGASPRHQRISFQIERQLGDYLDGKQCQMYHAPVDVRLFEQDGDDLADIDTVVQPDIFIVCDPGKIDQHGCKGAPDMVIEILSPSTRRHDRLTKIDLYQRAGVREYWIVSPEEKAVQVLLLEDGHFAVKDFGADGDRLKVNILEDCFIELGRVFPE